MYISIFIIATFYIFIFHIIYLINIQNVLFKDMFKECQNYDIQARFKKFQKSMDFANLQNDNIPESFNNPEYIFKDILALLLTQKEALSVLQKEPEILWSISHIEDGKMMNCNNSKLLLNYVTPSDCIEEITLFSNIFV